MIEMCELQINYFKHEVDVLWAEQYDKSDIDEEGDDIYDDMITPNQVHLIPECDLYTSIYRKSVL